MFERYETLLAVISSEDYWSDEGIDIAASHVSQFESSDWRTLESVLLLRSELWRGRCAESLSDSNDDRALRILLTLLKAEDESVVFHAIESIESLILAGYVFDPQPIVMALGERLEASTRTLELMATTLVSKCGHPRDAR
jgi:hypothetical protein